MKRILSTLFGLAVLCLFAEAQAVPATVSFTGRLTTSTGPVNGNVSVTFTLFNQAANGTAMWTETRPNLMATMGLVYADLGALTTLDDTILGNSPLFLEIQVGSEILTPRLPLQSVPYAIRSETSNTLGDIAPGDVVTTVNASGGISASRTGNTVTLTGTAVAGTAPISVAAGNVSLVTCSANQIYKMVGGAWACAADVDTNTTYTAAANSGVVLNTTAFGLMTCSNGQVLKAGATAGTWACGADIDTNTTYTAAANSGVVLNTTAFGLMTCSNGQVLKAGATAGTWACGADNDTNTTYTGTAPISVSGSTISLATSGVTSTHLGDGAAGLGEMAPYQDNFVHTFAMADVALNMFYWEPTSSLVVPTGGQATCIVGQSSRVNHATTISGTNYMYGYSHVRPAGDTGNGSIVGGLSSTYSTMYFQNGGSASSTSVSGTTVLAAGTWQFGCRVGMSSTTNVTGGTCNLNVLCF